MMKIIFFAILFATTAFADLREITGSIDTKFVNYGDSKTTCVVIEPNNELRQKHQAKQAATRNTPAYFKARKPLQYEVRSAKSLCLSRYDNGRKKIDMYAYFDGKNGYRVHCSSQNNNFVCKNMFRNKKHLPNRHTVLSNSGDLLAKIKSLENNKFSDDGQIFKIRDYYFSGRQKVFLPGNSKEQRDNKDAFTNIRTIAGRWILPNCKNSSGDRTGFNESAVCGSLFKEGDNCSDYSKINVCKHLDGGLVIKQDDDSELWIKNCEYQPAAMHFYCSGNVGGNKKVYFERYGVVAAKKPAFNCPNGITSYLESLTCHVSLHRQDCLTLDEDIFGRCRGVKEGDANYQAHKDQCNFYSSIAEGKKCPELAEYLTGLGCNTQARYGTKCDFRHPEYTSGGGTTTTQPTETAGEEPAEEPVADEPVEPVTAPVEDEPVTEPPPQAPPPVIVDTPEEPVIEPPPTPPEKPEQPGDF